jgi:hypothetical protein
MTNIEVDSFGYFSTCLGVCKGILLELQWEVVPLIKKSMCCYFYFSK